MAVDDAVIATKEFIKAHDCYKEAEKEREREKEISTNIRESGHDHGFEREGAKGW